MHQLKIEVVLLTSLILFVGQQGISAGNICRKVFGDGCDSGWRFICITYSPVTCKCVCSFAAEGISSPLLPSPAPCTPQPLISGAEYNIPDAELTASSRYYSTRYPPDAFVPENSRLNQCLDNSDIYCAWAADKATTGSYIQADLGRNFEIHQVAIQGRGADKYCGTICRQWVTKFSLALSVDGTSYTNMDNDGQGYTGAHDENTVVIQDIQPTVARYVRVVVMGYHNHPSIRWEVYGCPTA